MRIFSLNSHRKINLIIKTTSQATSHMAEISLLLMTNEKAFHSFNVSVESTVWINVKVNSLLQFAFNRFCWKPSSESEDAAFSKCTEKSSYTLCICLCMSAYNTVYIIHCHFKMAYLLACVVAALHSGKLNAKATHWLSSIKNRHCTENL